MSDWDGPVTLFEWVLFGVAVVAILGFITYFIIW